ncbi:MAG: Rieske 2Fe-2S domain-containing protein [Gemmatimonadota bacterium]
MTTPAPEQPLDAGGDGRHALEVGPEREDLLREMERLIAGLEEHPDPAVRDQVQRLLAGIDAVHRTALTHLLDGIHGMAGEAFVNRLTADPAVRLLLMSYDLLAVDRRLLAEEALDTVRGHLHAHGVDVELVEILGGVVSVRLHGLDRAEIGPAAVRRDLERALKVGLVGFQELAVHGRETPAAAGGFIPLSGLRRANRPVYRVALAADELPPGRMRAVEVEGHPVLIANVDGEFHAVQNRCGESPLPLEFGVLAGTEIRCSWHGCRYDVRSGRRLDAPRSTDGREAEERLRVFPVALEDGDVKVAVGVEPVPA